jgi:hypothetical protein
MNSPVHGDAKDTERAAQHAFHRLSAAAKVKSVVLVHGGFVDGSGWERVYDLLKKDGYDVLRRTTRKHGVASKRCEQRCWIVCRKPKLGRSGDEVRQEWCVI